jgi:poly(3-hydroxyoctanoate) depolymerase
MPLADTLIFLPGALGRLDAWKPVANALRHPGARRFIGWPGFGGVPPDPTVKSLDDLATRLASEITGPADILAQSMGGVIAVLATLEKPEFVRHLVLSVTSGGIDLASLGASDWRPLLAEVMRGLPPWFVDERRDLSHRLREIDIPVLLLWGDNDPFSPIAVGQRLAELFPAADLLILEGGTHDLIIDRAADIAPRIDRHLRG